MSKIITVHDGYDIATPLISERHTKTWDIVHWSDTLEWFTKVLPEYEIIQLGSKTSRPIPGVKHNLLNKTTLTEAFDILKTSSLHIDGDSGMVHAATRMGVPCIVLWGPTPEYFYGYPQNINLRSNRCFGSCYGMETDWNNRCVLGHKKPICMDSILPFDVVDAAVEILKPREAKLPPGL